MAENKYTADDVRRLAKFNAITLGQQTSAAMLNDYADMLEATPPAAPVAEEVREALSDIAEVKRLGFECREVFIFTDTAHQSHDAAGEDGK